MKVLMMLIVLAVVGCGEQQIAMDADAGVLVDAGWGATDAQEEEDAGQDRGDAAQGAPDGAAVDASDGGGLRPDAAAPPDAGTPLEDAGGDAAFPVDAGTDAEPDAGSGSDAGTVPAGAAVDVTGSRCALDSVGNFWCWGRWTPVEDVRLLGTGFTSAAGSCALRGREVWCAEFTTLTMLAVIEGSSVLEVDSIAEYSDLHRGCGWRPGPEGWGEAVCWQSRFGGWDVAREGGTGSELVAVTATEPRRVWSSSGWEAIDINPPVHAAGSCRSNGLYVECDRSTGGTYWVARPPGDHYILGFAMSCAHNAGLSTCNQGGSSWTVSNPGFRDHAVAWPIGTWRTVEGVPWYWEARGLCVGGDFGVRCYDDAGTLAYTVNW